MKNIIIAVLSLTVLILGSMVNTQELSSNWKLFKIQSSSYESMESRDRVALEYIKIEISRRTSEKVNVSMLKKLYPHPHDLEAFIRRHSFPDQNIEIISYNSYNSYTEHYQNEPILFYLADGYSL